MRTRVAPSVGFVVDYDGRDSENVIFLLLFQFRVKKSIPRSHIFLVLVIVYAWRVSISRAFSNVVDVSLHCIFVTYISAFWRIDRNARQVLDCRRTWL